MLSFRWLPLISLLLLLSCKAERHVEHSFYYWRTTFDNDTEASRKRMAELGVRHFYIRYMDVAWRGGMPTPVGKLNPEGSAAFIAKPFTPVVNITTETFEHLGAASVDSLAIKVSETIKRTTAKMPGADTLDPQEIQIDCDWTIGTRDKYFAFLRKIKTLNPNKTISATIRLYAYKYHKSMGVPPVDRGLLMCYNIEKIERFDTRNSIFSFEDMRKYLEWGPTAYPLPLDVALPVFSWQVWFRGGKFKDIVHNDIVASGIAVKENANIYRITKDTVIDENYFRIGDQLRYEEPDKEDLEKAANLLLQKIPTCKRLSFFAWDNISTTKYEKQVKAIYQAH